MTDENTTTKSKKPVRKLGVTIPPELEKEIEEFMASIEPDLKKKIEQHAVKGHFINTFALFAIRHTLDTANKKSNREWGTGITKLVEETIETNKEAHAAGEWWNIRGIGRSFLVEAGHNPNTVKRWLEVNREMIDAHHADMGIDDIQKHNRQAVAARKKQEG